MVDYYGLGGCHEGRAFSLLMLYKCWSCSTPKSLRNVQVLSIDGATTEGWDGDRAAKLLRGTSGSSVMVKFARRSEQVPGVAGRPEQQPKIELKQVTSALLHRASLIPGACESQGLAQCSSRKACCQCQWPRASALLLVPPSCSAVSCLLLL